MRPWILLLAIFVNFPLCKEEYLRMIPNGKDSMYTNEVSEQNCLLCHRSPFGVGTNNSFGLDFMNNDWKWDSTLANRDSDGDGFSNGVELGDPQGVWEMGDLPERKPFSFPGDDKSVPQSTGIKKILNKLQEWGGSAKEKKYQITGETCYQTKITLCKQKAASRKPLSESF